MPAKRKNKSKKKQTDPQVEAEVFTSPQSPTVVGGSYYSDVRTCVIAYQDKKRDNAPVVFYAYGNVDPIDWAGLMDAEHKQTYINKVFKPKYKGIRQEEGQ